MSPHSLVWAIFITVIPAILTVDLLVLQREARKISLKESVLWTLFWAALAVAFDGVVLALLGSVKAMEFLTAYIIEESLSFDNMFVFIMIFSYFGVPANHQRRILHWGIFLAILLRLIFIFAGVSLLNAFHWMLYVFGGILIFTGLKMAFGGDDEVEPEKNILLRLFKKFMPFLDRHSGQEFFVRKPEGRFATPAFATLLVIAASDVVFAVDSIPAVLAISNDFLIVASSNVFAVLGLRAIYFLISGIMGMFRFLKLGISAILCFVGVKMILAKIFPFSTALSLGVVAGILAVSILASVIFRKK